MYKHSDGQWYVGWKSRVCGALSDVSLFLPRGNPGRNDLIEVLRALVSGHYVDLQWKVRYGMLASVAEERMASQTKPLEKRTSQRSGPNIPQMCIDAWTNVGKFLPAKDILSVASLSKGHMEAMWKKQGFLETVLSRAGIKIVSIKSIPALLADYDACFTPPPWLAAVVDPVTEIHFQNALRNVESRDGYGRAIIGNNIPKGKIKDCITIICQILRLPRNDITALFLTHSNIGDEEAKMLADALQHDNCKVAVLNLGANNITNHGFEAYILKQSLLSFGNPYPISSSIIGSIAVLNLNNNKINLTVENCSNLQLLTNEDPDGWHGDFRLQYVSILLQRDCNLGAWLMGQEIRSKLLKEDKYYINNYGYSMYVPKGDHYYYFDPYGCRRHEKKQYYVCGMDKEYVLEYDRNSWGLVFVNGGEAKACSIFNNPEVGFSLKWGL